MTARSTPPFRADQVGSLLRPVRLLKARYGASCKVGQDLEALENECIRDVVALQEKLGLSVITDGEFRRESWRSGLIGAISGLTERNELAQVATTNQVQMESFAINAAPCVVDKLKRVRGVATNEFLFLKSITSKTVKVTLPSPSFVHFLRGTNAIDPDVYPDIRDFFSDLARVYREEIADLAKLGATYIQLDEVPLALLCDPAIRERLSAKGENPDQLIDWYLSTLNAVLSDIPPHTTIAVHFCRGNSAGQSGGQGGFEPLAERVFSRLKAHALFLEFDGLHAGSFSPLRMVPDDKMVVLGLISTKVATLEDPEYLKRRVEAAARFVPLDRLCISPQCGFSSRDKGSGLSEADQIAKLSLLVRTAEEIWH